MSALPEAKLAKVKTAKVTEVTKVMAEAIAKVIGKVMERGRTKVTKATMKATATATTIEMTDSSMTEILTGDPLVVDEGMKLLHRLLVILPVALFTEVMEAAKSENALVDVMLAMPAMRHEERNSEVQTLVEKENERGMKEIDIHRESRAELIDIEESNVSENMRAEIHMTFMTDEKGTSVKIDTDLIDLIDLIELIDLNVDDQIDKSVVIVTADLKDSMTGVMVMVAVMVVMVVMIEAIEMKLTGLHQVMIGASKKIGEVVELVELDQRCTLGTCLRM